MENKTVLQALEEFRKKEFSNLSEPDQQAAVTALKFFMLAL